MALAMRRCLTCGDLTRRTGGYCSRHGRGSGGAWETLRLAAYRRDGGQCQGCLRSLSLHEARIDHVVPLSEGGANVLANLQVLCLPCHRAKTPHGGG